VATEITMADGTHFVATGETDAESMTKKFERRGFVAVELETETIYINPVHVAVIRDVSG
jgi:hypothetical protein